MSPPLVIYIDCFVNIGFPPELSRWGFAPGKYKKEEVSDFFYSPVMHFCFFLYIIYLTESIGS